MDTIANLLSIIKNGYLAKKSQVTIPYFKVGENLAKILVKRGYLENVKCHLPDGKAGMSNVKSWEKTHQKLVLTLKYDGKKPVLTDVKRVSKPGLRIYVDKTRIPRVLGGQGLTIISTSQGLMTDKEAKEKGLGGEIICKAW